MAGRARRRRGFRRPAGSVIALDVNGQLDVHGRRGPDAEPRRPSLWASAQLGHAPRRRVRRRRSRARQPAPRGAARQRPSRFRSSAAVRPSARWSASTAAPSARGTRARARRCALALRSISSRRPSRSTTRCAAAGRGAVGHRRPDAAVQLAVSERRCCAAKPSAHRAAAGRCRCCSSTSTASRGQRHARPSAGSKALVEAGGVIRGSARETDVVGPVRRRRVRADPARHRQRGRRVGGERIRDRIAAHQFLWRATASPST